MYIVRCAQSRTALAAPSKNGMKSWKALARATGASRRAGVGWVRSLAFLSILR